MRRGRPRHDDVLTPREWEVLDLLRGGLTNEQIASQLGISLDTAKFHVSEILSKLNVETRQQAAAWQGRPRFISGLGLPAALARLSSLKLAGVAVLAAAAIGLGALAAGVLISDPGPAANEASDDIDTGDETLDAIIESMLYDDAAALAARFAGVAAREGGVLGGPIGLYQARAVALDEWTQRLASAVSRRLYAVVREPREPFAWHQAPAPSVPRAAILDAARDYDVLLIVESLPDNASAWRFSVLDGSIIDIVVDVERFAIEPPQARGAFLTRLADLMPSPDEEPGMFLVLPPESDRLPPRQPAPTGPPNPAPAPVSAPTFAPDGRTGDLPLDDIIESLLNASAADLQQQYAGLSASQEQWLPDTNLGFQPQKVRVPADQWTSRLADAGRTLHAVFTDDPVPVRVVLAVDTGGAEREAWRFGVDHGGRLVYVDIFLPAGGSVSDPAFDEPLKTWTPDVPSQYFRFYVLPPRDQLPVAPSSRSLSTRTGDANLDAILALVEARDADGLIALNVPPEEFVFRDCFLTSPADSLPRYNSWAREAASYDYRLHAIARVPAGWSPAAAHVIILVREVNPYAWEALGIYERNGRVVGVGPGCGPPEGLYPPETLLLPPAVAGLDPTRRSQIPAVDAVLDAIQAGNETALAALIQYGKVPCSHAIGVGAPPKCPDGIAPGTLVDALERGCEGHYYVPSRAAAELIRNLSDPSLYALVERPAARPGGSPVYAVTLDRPSGAAYTLLIESGRIVRVETTCPAPADTIWQVRGTPDFLLPPP